MSSWIFCSWSAHGSVAENFLLSKAHGNERFCRLPVKSYCAHDPVTAPVLAFPGMVKERKGFLGTRWGCKPENVTPPTTLDGKYSRVTPITRRGAEDLE